MCLRWMKEVAGKVVLEKNCFSGSSKIWSDKLKPLHDKMHREKRGRSYKQFKEGIHGTKSEQR